MLFWNVKGSVLKGAKSLNKYFSYGEEVPEDEIIDEKRKNRLLRAKWLVEGKTFTAASKGEAQKAPGPKTDLRGKK